MGFDFGQQGLVVLLWELEHFLKMDHLGLVERYWSEMNIVGIQVVYTIPTNLNNALLDFSEFISGYWLFNILIDLICRSKHAVLGDTNWSWVLLFN